MGEARIRLGYADSQIDSSSENKATLGPSRHSDGSM